MKYSEIKIIDEQWIYAEIKEITVLMNKADCHNAACYDSMIVALKNVKSKLISATSILEKTFDAGFDRGYALSSDESFGGGSNITEYNREQYLDREIDVELQPVSTK